MLQWLTSDDDDDDDDDEVALLNSSSAFTANDVCSISINQSTVSEFYVPLDAR